VKSSKKFAALNPQVSVRDGLALCLSICNRDEIATRQLLREYEMAYPLGYGKHIALKTVLLLGPDHRSWLRSLY
jgi:hypothetical protein